MFYYDGGIFAVLGVLIDGFLSMHTTGNSITLKLLISKNLKKEPQAPKGDVKSGLQDSLNFELDGLGEGSNLHPAIYPDIYREGLGVVYLFH